MWYSIVRQRENEKLSKVLSQDEIKQLENDKISFEDGVKLSMRIWNIFINGGLTEMIEGAELAAEVIADRLSA